MSGTGGFLLVRTGNRRVGLELSHVVEVTQIGPVHPVPALEPAVRGVVEVHGRLVPVVHLGAWLDAGPCPAAFTVHGVVGWFAP